MQPCEVMEQLTEEEMAAIWAKLEALGKKLDENLLLLDNMNQKLGEVHAKLRNSVTASSGQPASASSSSSPTSSPPMDATIVVLAAATEPPEMAPARCSTLVPYQAARVSVFAATPAATPTPSSTTAPPLDADLAVPCGINELLQTAHDKCSILCLDSDVSTDQPVVLSLVLEDLPKDVPRPVNSMEILSPRSFVGRKLDTHTRCLIKCHWNELQSVEVTPQPQTYVNEPLSVEYWGSNIIEADKHVHNLEKVLEVPVSKMMERPIPWPSFKFNQQGEFVQWKPPWPPLVQFVNAKHHQFELKALPLMTGQMFQIRTKEVGVVCGLLILGLSLAQITHSTGPRILAISKSEEKLVSLANHLLLLELHDTTDQLHVSHWLETGTWFCMYSLLYGNNGMGRLLIGVSEVGQHGSHCMFLHVLPMNMPMVGYQTAKKGMQSCVTLANSLNYCRMSACFQHHQFYLEQLLGKKERVHIIAQRDLLHYLKFHMNLDTRTKAWMVWSFCQADWEEVHSKLSLWLLSINLECGHSVNSMDAICKEARHSGAELTQQDLAAYVYSLQLYLDFSLASSRMLARCLNFVREITCNLNESKQLIFKQNGETTVEVLEFKQYMCYLKLLLVLAYGGDRLAFNIKESQMPWDPGIQKFKYCRVACQVKMLGYPLSMDHHQGISWSMIRVPILYTLKTFWTRSMVVHHTEAFT